MLCSFVMLGAVLAVQLLGLSTIFTLALQIAAGMIVYVLLSVIFRLAPFRMLLKIIKNMRSK